MTTARGLERITTRSLEPEVDGTTPVVVHLPPFVTPEVFEVIDLASGAECLLVTGWLHGTRPAPVGLDTTALADLAARTFV